MFYYINVVVHVLAAVIWLGGLFFFALVGAPVLRRIEPAALRASLFQQLGERFRVVGWVAIALLLVTGVINLYFRGVLDRDLVNATFWTTRFGRILGVKLTAILGMLVLQMFHDFQLGPAAGRASAGTEEAIRLRRRAALVARFSALLGLLILVAAVFLVRTWA
jgi:copper resistance protein D